ncbi:MAG: hypothetical protein QXT77_07350, partial [Candidatus Methanomethylicaceae archaeon]
AIALSGTFSAEGARIATAMVPVDPEDLIRIGVARVKERRTVRVRGHVHEEVLLLWRGVERTMAVHMIIEPE